MEDFLNEFNIAGRIEALAEKEGQKIVRQPSINSLRTSIIKEAQQANISPTTWEVQTSVQGVNLKGISFMSSYMIYSVLLLIKRNFIKSN